MEYISTRNNFRAVKSAEAIKFGMVPTGGLFVPDHFPGLDLNELKGIDSYSRAAMKILSLYLTDFDKNSLEQIVKNAYSSNFHSPDIAPLVQAGKGIHILELWHGPTAAFKDLALQCMPSLLLYSLQVTEQVNKVIILVATSGDTGMAALDGFCDKEKIDIIVFYPDQGVSAMQKRQMITKTGRNVRAVGVRGNFDECQSAVKLIFQDATLKNMAHEKGTVFSSANSINWGRLVPQIVYYFWAYIRMVKQGAVKWNEKINICVPTGNFGNILSAYYARQMGLPVNKFICASNSNNILTDFIHTGTYDLNRSFYVTSSPSMDILISSNLERFIFDIYDRQGDKIADLYKKLQEQKSFTVEKPVLQKMQALFHGDFTTEEETFRTIKSVYNEKYCLLDTHTAVGYSAIEKYRSREQDHTPVLLTSTASPYKFPAAVYKALTGEQGTNDFELVKKLNAYTGVPVHPGLQDIDKREILHSEVIDADKISALIRRKLAE